MKYIYVLSLLLLTGCKFDDQGPYINYENIFFESLELRHGNLTLYDLSSGPDVQLILQGDEESFSFPTENDLSLLPFTWDFSQDSINITDGVWQILITDIDSEGENEEMINFRFNPYQKYLQFDQSTEFDLYYEHWQMKLKVRVL